MGKLAPDITNLMLITALGVSATACSATPSNQPATQATETVMSDTLRGKCTIGSAKITLVDEAIMTRAALNAETASAMGKTTELAKGDPRLQKLSAVLDGTNPILADIPSLDARIVLRLTCDDSSERTIIGSTSGDQGMYVAAGEKFYRVPASFRSDIEAILR